VDSMVGSTFTGRDRTGQDVRVLVRVEFLAQRAVGFLDVALRGILLQPQQLQHMQSVTGRNPSDVCCPTLDM
jgi:hypothetical protein